MIHKCPKTLDRFRQAGLCEWCGLYLGRREPHHLVSRGHAGGTRLDIPANLVSLCPFFQGNNCHQRFGDDPRCRGRFLRIICDREGFESPEAVEAYLWAILALPKGSRIPAAPVMPW